MKDRDFLWCALNLMLDDEEDLAGLCPACRERAMEERCAVCGIPMSSADGSVNSSFDETRFQRLKRGDAG